MERGTFSAVGGSENGVRRYSKNTRTLQGLLGVSDRELQKSGFKAGQSQWIEDYQGSYGYGDSNEKQRVRRFFQSVYGKLSRTKLKSFDTVGRPIPTEVLNAFSDTVFKDLDGTILSFWHWTDKKFTHFMRGDIGFHAGTFDASHAIMFAKSKPGEKGFFKEMYFNSKSPLFIDRDLATSWTPRLAAVASNVLNDNEIQSISKLY